MSEPIPDVPQPPRPDGTRTEIPRPGRLWPYLRCRWCDTEVTRGRVVLCPICDSPMAPEAKL